MTFTAEANRRSFYLRLGSWEAFAQREAMPARYGFSRPGPGEVILDVPGGSVAFTNHARVASGKVRRAVAAE